MPTRFVLVGLKPGVDPVVYEQFIRQYDYPVLPELPTIIHYRTHRIHPDSRDRERLPYDYIEQIVVSDVDAYWRDLDSSLGFQRFRAKNPEFVDRKLDFWAEVVHPAPLQGAVASPNGVVQRWDEVPEDAGKPGLPLRRVHGRALTAILVRLFPGVIVTPQHHPEEQMVHMLSGRLRLQVGPATWELGPGHVAIIPSEVPHSGEAIGHEPAVYLEVLAKRPS